MSVDAKYKTTATASGGGRDGKTALADGTMSFDLVVPKELGGPDALSDVQGQFDEMPDWGDLATILGLGSPERIYSNAARLASASSPAETWPSGSSRARYLRFGKQP